jgi:hypothetical protein
MRAVVTTKTTKFNIEGDFFKLDNGFLIIMNGENITGMVDIKTLSEAHLSVERRNNFDN